jgi:hypothetical protein
MSRTILVLTLMFALAGGAAAYDQLYTGDTAAVADAPSFGMRGTFLYLSADSAFNEDGEAEDWPQGTEYKAKWVPLRITYAPLHGVEVGACPIFMMEDRSFASVEEDYSGTGIGDTWAWAKYNFSLDPVLTARLGVKLPTGNDEVLSSEHELVLGTGQTDLDAAVMVGLPAGKGLLDLALGYRIRLARKIDESSARVEELANDEKPGDEIHFLVGFRHEIGEAVRVRLAADGFFGAQPTIDGELIPTSQGKTKPAKSAVFVNPGVDYTLPNGVSVGFDMHYPLMGTSIDKYWGFGLSLGFGS